MQIPAREILGGGGRLCLASLGWSPPLSVLACFSTGSKYTIMTLPVVLWIPDLKGQRPLAMTLNLPLMLQQQWQRRRNR